MSSRWSRNSASIGIPNHSIKGIIPIDEVYVDHICSHSTIIRHMSALEYTRSTVVGEVNVI
ncbi:MAG: hypothetical protein K8F30_04680, partial [Taibaiella sp.]|nr:hypothetical protein [Taibaiella sp.]